MPSTMACPCRNQTIDGCHPGCETPSTWSRRYKRRDTTVPMKTPPHPGLSIRQDCLAPLALTVTAGAKALGVSRQSLSDLVNGHAGISPEMAIRLDKAFGGGAETWRRLRVAFDMARALKGADGIKVQRVPTPSGSPSV